MNPRVAERKQWSKFGLSAKDSPGPDSSTTSIGENIIFRPSVNWRKDAKEEKTEAGIMKDKLKDKKVKCRICNGEHFTARCPFKDTMAPVGEENAADVSAGVNDPAEGVGGGGGGGGVTGKNSYVPPHLRTGAPTGSGDRMGGGKYDRDRDDATLRVTNVSFRIIIIMLLIVLQNADNFRYLKWPKSKTYAICLSGLGVSQEYSLLRIEKLGWLRDSLSLVFRRG